VRRGRETDFDDGRPMPPVELPAAVGGSGDARWSSERGRHDAEGFKALAAKHGLAARREVLDCG
jgi:hypothetical protein